MALAALGASASALAASNAVLAIYQQPETLDPYNTNTTLTTAVTKSFYEGLFSFDKDMKVKNVLAESYEVSKDGLVYTFKLRQGVKFHDGSDFNAAAAKANLERVMNPANRLLRANQFNRVSKVEAINAQTLRITLKEAFGPFINSLAHPSAAMISPTALQKWGKDIAFHPVGTGPFEFVEWKQTEAIVGKKFTGYWKNGYPKIDQISWKPVLENNTRAAMLQTGEADFAYTLPYEQIAALKQNSKLTVESSPSIIARFLVLNNLQKPFDNPKVREAIGYAINKEALAKVAFNGYAFPAQGFVPQGVEYAVKMQPIPYNVQKARELLQELDHLLAGGVVVVAPEHGLEAVGVAGFLEQLAWNWWMRGLTPRPPSCACTMWAGRHLPAKPTGPCAPCSQPSPGHPNWPTTPSTATQCSMKQCPRRC